MSDQTAMRVQAGLQCPECFGVWISARRTRFDASPIGWLCEECGCQFSPLVDTIQRKGAPPAEEMP